MKQAAKGVVWLVEHRIFSLPRILAADALSRLYGNKKNTGNNTASADLARVSLPELKKWWNKGGNKIVRDNRFDEFSDHDFSKDALITYRAIPHPENTVSVPKGGELLEIALSNKAVASMRNYLGDGSSRNGWRLDACSAYIPVESRFGILVTVFSPKHPAKLVPENLDHFSNRTAQHNDRLWPAVYSALCIAEDKLFGSAVTSGQERGRLWSDDKRPFGIPPALLERPELHPAEEYDFYNTLFVRGPSNWARSCEPYDHIDSPETFRKFEISTEGSANKEDIYLSRAMTLWELPSLALKEKVIERVLRISLGSRLMKNLTYNYRLLASALKTNHLDGNSLSSKELRGIAFQYDIAHQALAERRQYLSKPEYDVTQAHLVLSGFDEYVENCSYLSERVLMAAESVDADKQREFEMTIQIAAFLFAAFALAAVFMDGYNFLAGQPDGINEMPPARFGFMLYVVAIIVGVLAVIALLIALKKNVMRWPWKLFRR